MYLSEIFENLIHGELAQVNIGEDSETYEITGEYAPLVSHINIALADLFTRFPLRFNELWLEERANRNNYPLLPKYSVNNPEAVPDAYILDSPIDMFMGDVVAIETVEDEEGKIIELNDANQDDPYLLNGPRTLYIKNPEEGRQIVVKYRENLPKIPVVDLVPEEYEVDIPEFMLQALLYYIAYRVHHSYPALEGTSESDKFLQKYDMECKRLESAGLITTSFMGNKKLELRGWV